MAEGIVERLEMVDVGQHQRQRCCGAHRLFGGIAQGLIEGPAIGDAGQRIGLGLTLSRGEIGTQGRQFF